MKLYHSPASPFVRKVVVLLHELNKFDDVELKTVTTTALASDLSLIAANPLARLPALERLNGVTLYDSRVITTYLDDFFQGKFYPSGDARWETLTLEATGDGVMDSAVSMVYELRLRNKAEQSCDWIEAQWAKVERGLDALNDHWLHHLSGPICMGHISVACALGYLDFRHKSRFWRKDREQLASWYSKFSQRRSMQVTEPDG
ncbi:MAG: glutathione S-transferase [Tateyamaria sp.]|nr:glutathione S-transferase [Tateyamaria sp.]